MNKLGWSVVLFCPYGRVKIYGFMKRNEPLVK